MSASASMIPRPLGPRDQPKLNLGLNESPYQIPDAVKARVMQSLDELHRYPIDRHEQVVEALARHHGKSPKSLVLTCGVDEALDRLIEQFPSMRFVIFRPTFIGYEARLKALGANYEVLPYDESFGIRDEDWARIGKDAFVVLANPNNPTGSMLSPSALGRLRRSAGKVLVDEAYIDFALRPSQLGTLDEDTNAFVFRSLSKSCALAGQRLGLLFGPEAVMQRIRDRQWFCSVDRITLDLALAVHEDPFAEGVVAKVIAGRIYLEEALRGQGFDVRPSLASFVLVRSRSSAALVEHLNEQGIIVLDTARLGLPDHVRMTVGTPAQNLRLVEAMSTFSPPSKVMTMQSEPFVEGLERSLAHVRGYVASQVFFDLLHEGVLDLVGEGLSVPAIAARKGYDRQLLENVFEYLVIEDVLEKTPGVGGSETSYSLTAEGRGLEQYKGWYYMMIGGYGPIFSNLTTMMKSGTSSASRNGALVGMGSCLISQYDAIPLTKEFMARVTSSPKSIVDFGCGNALYLCTFCESLPGVRAVGVEPSRGAYEAGCALVREKGLEDRVQLVNCEALDFAIEEPPEFLLFGFVLHELYAQIGEEQLVEYLRKLGKKFEKSHMIVMEVDYDIDNHAVMKSPVGRGFYNPFYLLHPFTNQKLLAKSKWVELFERAGYRILAQETCDAKLEPSGLVIGMLLQYGGGEG